MSTTANPELVRAPDYAFTPKQLLINGEMVDAASGETFETLNPSTGEVITNVAAAGAEDVNRAVAAARAAFEGPWSKFTPRQRERVLLDYADAVEAKRDELVALDSIDMGFPIAYGAIAGAAYGPEDVLRYFAGWPSKVAGETLPNSAGENILSYTLRQPVGVVGAIAPWNSPRYGVVKIAPALAAGCTVVMKPSEVAPLAAVLLAEIAAGLDIPPGVINMLPGDGRTAGAALAEHADVDKLTFTGSTATGQSLVHASAGNLKRVTLELGGKSPDIIFADADLDVAAMTASMAVFGNSGQMCTAGSRIFVERPIFDEFVARVAAFGETLKVGNSMDPTTAIGPIVSETQLGRVTGYLDSAKAEGAQILSGGQRLTDDGLDQGYFLPPTVLAGVSENMRVAREEIFGPVASIFPFDDIDDVIKRANATSYGLVGGVWTSDLRKAMRVANDLQTGVVWINNWNTFDPGVPFGGHKMSGLGTELGRYGVESYLNVKSVWVNYS